MQKQEFNNQKQGRGGVLEMLDKTPRSVFKTIPAYLQKALLDEARKEKAITAASETGQSQRQDILVTELTESSLRKILQMEGESNTDSNGLYLVIHGMKKGNAYFAKDDFPLAEREYKNAYESLYRLLRDKTENEQATRILSEISDKLVVCFKKNDYIKGGLKWAEETGAGPELIRALKELHLSVLVEKINSGNAQVYLGSTSNVNEYLEAALLAKELGTADLALTLAKTGCANLKADALKLEEEAFLYMTKTKEFSREESDKFYVPVHNAYQDAFQLEDFIRPSDFEQLVHFYHDFRERWNGIISGKK